MSYELGEVVHLHFEVDLDSVATDATTDLLVVVKPDGTQDPITPTHDGTGIYDEDYDTTGKLPGRYRWVFSTTGTQAVASGVFDVYDPLATDAPVVGVVQPWTDATAIRAHPKCATLAQGVLTDAARIASELLYALSGRQFTGGPITATVRPTARPRGWGIGTWARTSPFGWYGTWGTCCGYGSAYGYGAALANGYGRCCEPPEVELGGYPISRITQVKIDGTVIPPAEYRVDDRRLLVRVRPTADATPTVRAGWPTCQRLDLPDTEPGTFSVTFVYGTPPPLSGVNAATVLGAQLALDMAGSSSDLPQRIRSITRQGESMVLIDPQEVLDKGRTGIPAVDLFIKAVNGAGLQQRAQAWSPDTARSRRTTWSAT